MEDVSLFLKGTVLSIPYVLIQFVGCVSSVFLRSRLPRVWVASMIGFFLLMVGNLSYILYFALLVGVFSKSGNYDAADAVAWGQQILQALLSLSGYTLIMIALFRLREAKAEKLGIT